MSKTVTVIKSNGERELFDSSKLQRSLVSAGATENVAKEITNHLENELIVDIHTTDIYRHAFDLLGNYNKPAAAQYSLRRALLELGPTGFPFEKFIAEVFKAQGFEAITGQIVQGGCVEHEVDVVAWNKSELIMVEAKYHNIAGIKSDLKVALYVKARFDDLKDGIFSYGGIERSLTDAILITNTKFTEHAIRYGECKKLKMIGWNYPMKGNLQDLVRESGLHPVTCLPSLSLKEKQKLMSAGIVLCKHVGEREAELVSLGVEKSKIGVLMEEVKSICSL
jgi:hypothetical protein